MGYFVSVILDHSIRKTLDYSLPEHWIASPGMRVEVPVKSSLCKGYILALKEKAEVASPRPIARMIEEEALPSDLLSLATWMARYYVTPLSKVLQAMIPLSIRKEIHPKTQLFLSLGTTKKELLELLPALQRKSPQQAKIAEHFLQREKGLFLTELVELAKTSKAPIESLIEKKILKSEKLLSEEDLILEEEYFPTQPKILNEEQKHCLEKIEKSLNQNLFETHLLYGVTGSGKTEIYLQAIQKALDLQKGVILLVPEIALTSQTIEKLLARFKEKIAIFHHRRSQGERFAAWHSVKKGELRIAIGARSAIFSPIKNLGLIIVDEEHDSSYKNEEMPSFHARNIAVMRGKLTSCPVILGSATPSLESYWNAKKGKYLLSTLLTRATKALLPEVHIIDMRKELPKAGGFTHFSEKLLEELQKRFSAGEQSLLFLNRRGFHRFLFCTQCSHVLCCPHCDLSLTFHKDSYLLSCHLCGFEQKPPQECPFCKSREHFQYKGFGTEHVEKSLKALFPQIRIARIDRDTTRKKHSHETLLKEFRAGKADVLIGTQMITKGLHFPCVTLVGILNVDSTLNIPDFRSAENVFQLLTQVAGRAGRAELPGEVILQTFMPENAIIKAAAQQDFLSFYDQEIESRKLFTFPPFSHMAKLLFSSFSQHLAKSFAEEFRVKLIQKLSSNYILHPVTSSGYEKIKDAFRFQFLIRGEKILPLSKAIEETLQLLPPPRSLRLIVDIDPFNTFF